MKCPIHDLHMYYHSPSKLYACQNIACIFALGATKDKVLNLDITDRWYKNAE